MYPLGAVNVRQIDSTLQKFPKRHQQSVSWSSSLWEPTFRYRVYSSQSLVPAVSQVDAVDTHIYFGARLPCCVLNRNVHSEGEAA